MFGRLTTMMLLGVIWCFTEPACNADIRSPTLEAGMTITRSMVFANDTILAPASQSSEPTITIRGENLVIDLANCLIIGAPDSILPDQYKGIGILAEGANITIKNARVKGYRVGLYAKDVGGLTILDCDFSYNYRMPITVQSDATKLEHTNYNRDGKQTTWLEEGAAIYLHECDHSKILGTTITQGQHGIVLDSSKHVEIKNNDIQFNTGLGISLNRSSHNTIVGNELSYNIRSTTRYSHHQMKGVGGLSLSDSSTDNIIAYNRATHCESGLSIVSEEKEQGIKGNYNFVYKNDFSFSPQKGIEIKGSQNNFWETVKLVENEISHCSIGIRLSASEHQPLGNAKANVEWKLLEHYRHFENLFSENDKDIDVQSVIHLPSQSALHSIDAQDSATISKLISALPSTKAGKATIPSYPGRQYILMNQWGPYNFKYPTIWLREKKNDTYIFALFGPIGNWRIKDAIGFVDGNLKSGSFPATLVATRTDEPKAKIIIQSLTASFYDQFGRFHPKGESITLEYEE